MQAKLCHGISINFVGMVRLRLFYELFTLLVMVALKRQMVVLLSQTKQDDVEND